MTFLKDAMLVWQEWLDSLDSDGGHIVLLFLMATIGLYAAHKGEVKGEDVLVGAGSALLMKLKDTSSNRERKNTTSSATSQITKQTEVVAGDSTSQPLQPTSPPLPPQR